MALDIKRFLSRFVEEARDHLGRIEAGVAALDRTPDDRDLINAVFRSAHTIKGSSRMLKLMSITETAHKMEDVLGALREGKRVHTPTLGRLLLHGVDTLAAQVDAVSQGQQVPDPDPALCAALAQAVEGGTEPTPAQSRIPTPAPAQTQTQAPNRPPDPAPIPGPTPVLPPVATAPNAPVAAALMAPQPRPDPAATARQGAAVALNPSGSPSGDAPPAEFASQSGGEPRLKMTETIRVRLDKLDELVRLMGEVMSSHAALRQRVVDLNGLERQGGSSLPAGFSETLRHFGQTLRQDVLAQERLMTELKDKSLQMRMLPLASVLDPAAHLVRSLARSLGKELECVVSGGDIELDRQLIDKLSDPLGHLLRNAADHGIEAPEERIAAGKPAHGLIHVRARQDGVWVVVEITDDGGGLPLDRIRAKAVQRGYLGQEQAAALSSEQVIDLIFLPGFSTSPIVTDISGRGVGLDVVRQTIMDDLQGQVDLRTRAGQGTTFELRLPISLAMMRMLLVQAGRSVLGFAAQHVAELIEAQPETWMSIAGRPAVILRNEFIPLVRLSELLDLPEANESLPSGPSPTGSLILVVRVRNEKAGLIVDDLLDERDMVVKPLPTHMRRFPLVSGILVLGSGELVSVLHVPAVMERVRNARGQVSLKRPGDPVQGGRLLVVDDSINTREIEKDVLESHGYHVTLAEDGLDGWQKALSGCFDAVLTDVEMPNLDGFALVERLRNTENYRTTPIIIITSRAKEEDKRRGIQVGADAYIVKGDFDQSTLVETLQNFLG